ncbi:unnamed protein product [Lymnaea stagnalis]|uniref:Uncharacterized protein n=1 Tax=Lymnaea stagnalis TaxID=6523 RepID=A0AAV2HXM7_LYMST
MTTPDAIAVHFRDSLQIFLYGLTTVTSLMSKKELSKWLVVYTCLSQVVPGQACGDNPLRRYEVVMKKINERYPDRGAMTLLNLLLDSNPDVFKPLLNEWRRYANCIGLVDTGYFKRSGLSALMAGSQVEDRDEQKRVPEEEDGQTKQDPVADGEWRPREKYESSRRDSLVSVLLGLALV